MKIHLFISSLTGNTLKIANALEERLIATGHIVTKQDSNEIRQPKVIADFYILCFWTRRGSLDMDSFKILKQFKDSPIIAVGTCGHYPDSEYAYRTKSYINGIINTSNACLGVFLSQGAVMLESTNRRRKLPPNRPHYLDDEGYARHLESQNHPDLADIENAFQFVLTQLPL